MSAFRTKGNIKKKIYVNTPGPAAFKFMNLYPPWEQHYWETNINFISFHKWIWSIILYSMSSYGQFHVNMLREGWRKCIFVVVFHTCKEIQLLTVDFNESCNYFSSLALFAQFHTWNGKNMSLPHFVMYALFTLIWLFKLYIQSTVKRPYSSVVLPLLKPLR